jgi:hypothetical protein
VDDEDIAGEAGGGDARAGAAQLGGAFGDEGIPAGAFALGEADGEVAFGDGFAVGVPGSSHADNVHGNIARR